MIVSFLIFDLNFGCKSLLLTLYANEVTNRQSESCFSPVWNCWSPLQRATKISRPINHQQRSHIYVSPGACHKEPRVPRLQPNILQATYAKVTSRLARDYFHSFLDRLFGAAGKTVVDDELWRWLKVTTELPGEWRKHWHLFCHDCDRSNPLAKHYHDATSCDRLESCHGLLYYVRHVHDIPAFIACRPSQTNSENFRW